MDLLLEAWSLKLLKTANISLLMGLQFGLGSAGRFLCQGLPGHPRAAIVDSSTREGSEEPHCSQVVLAGAGAPQFSISDTGPGCLTQCPQCSRL